MLEKYESGQKQIRRSAEQVWEVMADFNNFTPMVEGRVEEWAVNSSNGPGGPGDECTFRVKGMPIGLRMVERVPGSLVKIEASDTSPFGFTFWVQLKETAPYDTRMRLVLHAEMNMMIKMMVGSKLRDGIDALAEQIAAAFS